MKDVQFMSLEATASGKLEVVSARSISVSTIRACPSFIMWPEHYRVDGTCRHDEVGCEETDCSKLKYKGEIFCEEHSS